MFDVGLQGDRDILKYIVGILKYIKVYPRVKIGKNPTFYYTLIWLAPPPPPPSCTLITS